MATVTTTKNDSGLRESFVTSGAAARSRPPGSPIAKLTYQDTVTIPAKLAANESEFVLNLTLPDNFYYRFLFWGFQAVSSTVDSFTPATGFELGANMSIIVDGTTPYRFLANNQTTRTIGVNGIKIDEDTTTNDFACFFESRISEYFIRGASTTVQCRWMDTSANTTAAVYPTYRAECLVYTLEQGFDFDTNTPALIFGG